MLTNICCVRTNKLGWKGKHARAHTQRLILASGSFNHKPPLTHSSARHDVNAKTNAPHSSQLIRPAPVLLFVLTFANNFYCVSLRFYFPLMTTTQLHFFLIFAATRYFEWLKSDSGENQLNVELKFFLFRQSSYWLNKTFQGDIIFTSFKWPEIQF